MRIQSGDKMANHRVYVNRVAHYHPKGILDNSHFEKKLDTSSEWIENRVGIRQRRYLDDYRGSMPVYEMCRRAVERLGPPESWDASSVDCIVSCGSLDDLAYPGPANMISSWLKLDVPAFHLKNACTSVTYALQVARSMIIAGIHKRILIVNGEPFTLQADYGDRASCILFGDAGTAMIVSAEASGFEIKDIELGGSGMEIVGALRQSSSSKLSIREFVSGQPERRQAVLSTINRMAAGGKFHQFGREVSAFVLNKIPEALRGFLKKQGLAPSEIDSIIFHQANLNLMRELCASIGVDWSRHRYNIDRYGNTSSAGWVSVLSEEDAAGRFKSGERIIISTFGAGMTWGCLYLIRS